MNPRDAAFLAIALELLCLWLMYERLGMFKLRSPKRLLFVGLLANAVAQPLAFVGVGLVLTGFGPLSAVLAQALVLPLEAFAYRSFAHLRHSRAWMASAVCNVLTLLVVLALIQHGKGVG